MTKFLILILPITMIMVECNIGQSEEYDPFLPPIVKVIPADKLIAPGDTLEISYQFNSPGLYTLIGYFVNYFDDSGKRFVFKTFNSINGYQDFTDRIYILKTSFDSDLFEITNLGDSLDIELGYVQYGCDCSDIIINNTIIYIK